MNKKKVVFTDFCIFYFYFRLGPEGRPSPNQCEDYAESRLIQRYVEVVLESYNNNFTGSLDHPSGNIAEGLLKVGMAKCVDWSIALLR